MRICQWRTHLSALGVSFKTPELYKPQVKYFWGRIDMPSASIATFKTNIGFTLIELMVVITIIAILALLALPSYQAKVVRDQIVEGSALASIAKVPIAAYWLANQSMPPDNASIGLPAADKIVSNMVRAVTVQDGAIHIIYGNRANGLLKDKTLTMRPAVVDDASVVPVAWVCAGASAPDKMTLRGENKTTVAPAYLPANCR